MAMEERGPASVVPGEMERRTQRPGVGRAAKQQELENARWQHLPGRSPTLCLHMHPSPCPEAAALLSGAAQGASCTTA